MSKLRLLIMALCASLCAMSAYAQQSYVLTLERMFTLADENSKTIQVENVAHSEAQEAVRVAQNGRLPDIELSLSASYLGNGCLMDRDFTNGQNIKMPHFGNNLAIKATQLIYGGGVVNTGITLAKLKEEMASAELRTWAEEGRILREGRAPHVVYRANRSH